GARELSWHPARWHRVRQFRTARRSRRVRPGPGDRRLDRGRVDDAGRRQVPVLDSQRARLRQAGQPGDRTELHADLRRRAARHPLHNRSCPAMTSRTRFTVASLLAASLAFGFAACKPIDPDAKKEDKAAATGNDDIAKATGLKTEKEQASYMVGMSVGKSLE